MNSKTPDPMAVEEAAIRDAVRRRLDELKGAAATLVDPRPWIKDRPWTSCLVAAGAGTVLGMLASGRKPAVPRQVVADDSHHNSASHRQDRRTLGAMLAASLMPALQPMIHDLIHTAMGGLTTGAGKGADRGTDKVADVTEERMPSGLAEDNKVVV